jgi:Ankyrin repeats (3 copies)/NACHT domain
MHNREYDIRSQADKTCAWLLKHETFLEWMHQPRGLLWIRGKPGAGKSTLLKYVLQETEKLELPPNRLVVASYFFHGRGAEIQKVTLGLFRSLLHQLLEKVPEMLSELTQTFKSKLETQGEPEKDWKWHPMELQELLAASLLKVGNAYTLRIFIDALDECGEEAAVGLVNYFQRLVSASRKAGESLSICFSCRHYPIMALESGFEICVEDENHDDIETYIQDELHLAIRDETKISILQQQVVARASGSFQWVVLVISRVCELYRKGKPLKFIQTHIQKTPPELNSLYRELLQSIEEESISQSLQLMQWICFAIRPLTLDELRHAIAVDVDTSYKSLSECRSALEYVDTQEEMECRLKDLCRGLAEIKQHEDGRVVQFIHQSVNDFLIQDGLRILDSSLESIDIAVGRAHLRLSRSCIRYIAMEEVGRWVDQTKSGTPRIDAVPLEVAFLKYAASWLPHAEAVEAKGIAQCDLLNFFQWPSNQILQRWRYIHETVYPSAWIPFDEESSLLHVASFYCLLSVLKAILETGVDIDSKDRFGWTPLSYAVEEGHEAVVKLLLEKAANVDSVEAALSLATAKGWKAVVELLKERISTYSQLA